MTANTRRAHVVLPEEIVSEIDELVGQRKRSHFIEEAVRERLEREHQRLALREGAGILKEEDYPYWRTPEDVSRWVHETRRGRPVVPPALPGEDISDALSAGQ